MNPHYKWITDIKGWAKCPISRSLFISNAGTIIFSSMWNLLRGLGWRAPKLNIKSNLERKRRPRHLLIGQAAKRKMLRQFNGEILSASSWRPFGQAVWPDVTFWWWIVCVTRFFCYAAASAVVGITYSWRKYGFFWLKLWRNHIHGERMIFFIETME